MPTEVNQGAELLDTLAIELARANTHLHIFAGLHENYNAFGNAKDFWDYTLAAHFGIVLVQIARAYDHHPKGLNLQHILLNAESLPLDEGNWQSLQKYRSFCAKTDPHVKKIAIWRNNIFAHYNRKVALGSREDFWSRYPLELADCQSLIDRAFEILEWASVVHGCSCNYRRFAHGKDDYHIVLDAQGLKP